MGISIVLGVIALIGFLIYKNLYSPLNKYNSLVDTILNEKYDIKTLDNPNFINHSEYSSLLLDSLNENINFDTAALKIACTYCQKLLDDTNLQEANVLYKRILKVVGNSKGIGLINSDQAAEFISTIAMNLNKVN